jgi:hypothetical protein
LIDWFSNVLRGLALAFDHNRSPCAIPLSDVFYCNDFVGVSFRYGKNIHILHPAYLVGTYLFDVSDVTFSPILVARNADRVVLVTDTISRKRSRNLKRSIIREISKKFCGEYDVIIWAAPRMVEANGSRKHDGSDCNPTHLVILPRGRPLLQVHPLII